MGTFTVASGLGMLFVGLCAMAVIGLVGLYVINNVLPNDKEEEDGR